MTHPRWCSTLNGVFLCAKCARKHQKYAKDVSLVKSIEADLWSTVELEIMKIGGNIRFKNHLQDYNIPMTTNNQQYKYYTKAAEYYRKLLLNEINHLNPNLIKPNLIIGIQLMDKYSNIFSDEASGTNINKQTYHNISSIESEKNEFNNISENQNYRNRQHNNQQNYDINEDLYNVFNSFGKFFGKVGDSISAKAKEMGLDETMKTAGEKMNDFYGKSKVFISDKTQQVKDSELFKTVKEKAEISFQNINRTFNEFMDNADSYNIN